MDVEIWMWAALAGFVVVALAVDLVALGRRADRVPMRRAVAWSVVWTALGLGFAALLWAWQGQEPAGEYLAGFLIEFIVLALVASVAASFARPHEARGEGSGSGAPSPTEARS